jgi:hypothetical protein
MALPNLTCHFSPAQPGDTRRKNPKAINAKSEPHHPERMSTEWEHSMRVVIPRAVAGKTVNSFDTVVILLYSGYTGRYRFQASGFLRCAFRVSAL